MATKGTSFSTLVYRTSSPLEGRPHSRILQFFRTLVLFFVLLVGFEEWCYIPAGSLPHIRRVISCILFSLEQSRVVDLTVAERFVQHVFGLVIHSSSCTRSMSGSALVIILDNVAGYRHDIVVALVHLLFYFAIFLSIFRTNNGQCLLPSISYNQSIAVLKMFRKARRSLCCSCQR